MSLDLALVTIGVVLAVVAIVLDVALGLVAPGRITGWFAIGALGAGLFLRLRQRRAARLRHDLSADDDRED